MGRLASLVEAAVAAAAGNQVANLVVNDLQGGVVEGADSGAAAVDAESRGAGDEEKDGREVHIDGFLRCIEDEDELEICKCWGRFCMNYRRQWAGFYVYSSVSRLIVCITNSVSRANYVEESARRRNGNYNNLNPASVGMERILENSTKSCTGTWGRDVYMIRQHECGLPFL